MLLKEPQIALRNLEMLEHKVLLDAYVNTIKAVDTSIVVVDMYTNHKPTLRTPWIRVTMIPNEASNVSQGIDSIIEHSGLFQVDCFTPKGTIVSFPIVDAIVKQLNERRVINANLLLERTWKGNDAIEETDWIRSPIFSRYLSYEYNVSVND